MAPVLLLLPEGRGSSKRPVRSAHNMPQRCSYRLKTPRSAISPTEQRQPYHQRKEPVLQGIGAYRGVGQRRLLIHGGPHFAASRASFGDQLGGHFAYRG